MSSRLRFPRSLLLALACIATISIVLTSCGGTATKTLPVVQLSLAAPVDGARVTVNSVRVFGTVDPPTAVVKIAGRRVHVTNGGFKRWVPLRGGYTNIGILAAAPGYTRTSIHVGVHKVGRREAGRPAPRQFTALDRANQLCARPDTKVLATLFAQLSRPPGAKDYVTVLHRLTAIGSRLVVQLRGIRPAPAKAGAYAAFVDHAQLLMRQADQLLRDVQARQVSRLAPLIKTMVAGLTVLGGQGTNLGLISCANDFTTPS